MKILVDNSGYHLRNLGDVCMLQAGVRRLRGLFPDAEIGVLTLDPELLADLVPGTVPLPAGGRALLCGDGSMLPGLRRFGIDAGEMEQALRRGMPGAARSWTGLVARARGRDAANYEQLHDFMNEAHAAVSTGGGFLTDSFADHGRQTLRLLELAGESGAVTAMFGQGIGPITDSNLRRTARRVLPRLDRLTLREAVTGPPLLGGYGVAEERITVTGDDAVETVFAQRADQRGEGLGLNVRVADYSGMGSAEAEAVCTAARRVAEATGCALLPVPISRHAGDSDVRTLEEMLGGDAETSAHLTRPEDVIHQAGRCRVVVTGSYHGSVFALSQGVPVVALAHSPYYEAKFTGVAERFGRGCVTVTAGDGFAERIERAVMAAWEAADEVREPLLESAARQVAAGRDAYGAFARLLQERKA